MNTFIFWAKETIELAGQLAFIFLVVVALGAGGLCGVTLVLRLLGGGR